MLYIDFIDIIYIYIYIYLYIYIYVYSAQLPRWF